MKRTAILLPTAYRPVKLQRTLQSIYATCFSPEVQVFASPVCDDRDSLNVLAAYRATVIERTREEYERGAVYAWNLCLSKAGPWFDAYVLGADDLIFGDDWLTQAWLALDGLGGEGLIGFNDLSSDGNVYAAHWLVSRGFLIETLGGVMYPPGYRSWWCDREVTDISKAQQRHAWAQAAIVEHFNYTFNKSPVDRTYADAQINYEADRQLYNERRALGFPRTWEPLLR